ncbi:hypothetical protein HJG60_009205 [Phyllostomus discolor]|uniref:Uncharacterized protein n=1 Tax=Phyllostomus discolor TaxID=89673 RepID=A0A833YSH6_9CHIR|nr:hypothetical protein HJG60_009205 [Phyllostomus discolor]
MQPNQLSSFPAIYFPETAGPQLPRLYSRFYRSLQIGISLTTRAFNWEIIKKHERIQSFSPRRCCPNAAHLRPLSPSPPRRPAGGPGDQGKPRPEPGRARTSVMQNPPSHAPPSHVPPCCTHSGFFHRPPVITVHGFRKMHLTFSTTANVLLAHTRDSDHENKIEAVMREQGDTRSSRPAVSRVTGRRSNGCRDRTVVHVNAYWWQPEVFSSTQKQLRENGKGSLSSCAVLGTPATPP